MSVDRFILLFGIGAAALDFVPFYMGRKKNRKLTGGEIGQGREKVEVYSGKTTSPSAPSLAAGAA